LLVLNDVTKHFGGVHALDGVNLTLGAEKIAGILGPNGAGKTTLINAITGFQPCTSGQILWNDEDITNQKNHIISRKGILRTFQIPLFFRGASVMGHLDIASSSESSRKDNANKEEKAWMYELAINILQNAGFEKALNTFMPVELVGLSYWQLKVLQVATAICRGAKLLFLDEPAGGLSREEADELARAIHFAADKGVKICIVEHRIGWLLGLAERAIVLDQGKVIADGSPEEVRNDTRVIKCYIGDEKNA
jgi:ABC-type branched-subunit amino acid transport system ATPase component